jgi:HEAT repeat protein
MNDQIDATLEPLLNTLRDPARPLPSALIYRLANPEPGDIEALSAVWERVPVERRRLLLSRMADAVESSFDLDFSAVALFALADEDAQVRHFALHALWENEQPEIMQHLIGMLRADRDMDVRATAAQSLGRFVLAGELGTLDAEKASEAVHSLLEAWESFENALDIRRRALESIAYSEHEDVPLFIRQAMEHPDVKMQASAIFAMGRSADERWRSEVMEALFSKDPEILYEAARAAGELSIAEAVPRLIELLDHPDREIKGAAVWALGETGGKAAQQALILLAEEEDDEDLLESIEDALNMAALGAGDFFTHVIASDDSDELEDYLSD